MHKIVQGCRDSRLELAGDSWLASHQSWHTCEACRPLACSLNSRLSPIARPSHQTTLFGKNWLFTFLLTLLYIYPYTHDLNRASRENFWERNPREKQDWLIHNLYLRDSSNSSILFLSIVKSLRGLLPKPFLTISISVRGLFGALGSS